MTNDNMTNNTATKLIRAEATAYLREIKATKKINAARMAYALTDGVSNLPVKQDDIIGGLTPAQHAELSFSERERFYRRVYGEYRFVNKIIAFRLEHGKVADKFFKAGSLAAASSAIAKTLTKINGVQKTMLLEDEELRELFVAEDEAAPAPTPKTSANAKADDSDTKAPSSAGRTVAKEPSLTIQTLELTQQTLNLLLPKLTGDERTVIQLATRMVNKAREELIAEEDDAS